jgi:transcriptional regulator with AAA-type ATPase domain
MSTTPKTDEHQGPISGPLSGGVPALVVAFPDPLAIPLPQGSVRAGREWFEARGVSDSLISSSHIELSRPGGVLHVADAGSRNGTFVDGARLQKGERAPLADGALLRVGRTLMVYREQLLGSLGALGPLGDLVGPFGLRQLAHQLSALEPTRIRNVLVEGESGTGKELATAEIARRLRPGKPCAFVNVSAIASTVFESQIFGHVRGAFSGADQTELGILRQNNGGTVVFDEIGELPLQVQPKLLRLLESRDIFPVGAKQSVEIDIAIVGATNRVLEDEVAKGTFRKDLHARFLGAIFELPPLRERSEDVYSIAVALRARAGSLLSPDMVEIEALELLMRLPLSANVRELGALVERTLATEPTGRLTLRALRQVAGSQEPARSNALTLASVASALEACRNNQSQAARRLGVSRGTLLRFLNRQRSEPER